MRLAPTLVLVLVTGCVTQDGDSPDDIDEVGLDGGKADGSQLSECETREIVALLNASTSAADLEAAGVHARAAKALVEHRDGPDATFGTEDDDLYDSVDEVDEVAYVGRAAFTQLAAAVEPRCRPDAYAEARDVEKAIVTFPAGTVAPTTYERADGGQFFLNGTEFWQKWSGGLNPTYSFAEGTDAGRLCMQASAIRFGEIMKDPPAELVKLDADTNWGGSFFNWNDDYSNPAAFGDGSRARLWAWRTGLIKWISQTKKDGSCVLPTRTLVVQAATACLAAGVTGAGEIQGCSASQ